MNETEHIFDDLPLLLTGEADRATVDRAAAHLRSCEDCQQELISALVAHASLSSAVRFAPELAMTAGPVGDAEIRAVTALPDLGPVFARARQEADTATHQRAPSKSSHRARWLVAAAAAAGLVAGLGGVVAAQHLDQGPATRSVALAPYAEGTVPASAAILGGNKMTVDASALPEPGAGKNYEVWLTDTARKNLQPLGWVGADGKGTYTVPTDLMRRFDAIEVSVQQADAPYNYSGVSVLRGRYS